MALLVLVDGLIHYKDNKIASFERKKQPIFYLVLTQNLVLS